MEKISSAAFTDTKPHYDLLDGWFAFYGSISFIYSLVRFIYYCCSQCSNGKERKKILEELKT